MLAYWGVCVCESAHVRMRVFPFIGLFIYLFSFSFCAVICCLVDGHVLAFDSSGSIVWKV